MRREITNSHELSQYLSSDSVVSFEIQTEAEFKFRKESGARSDPHRARITGISFAAGSDDGVFVPLERIRTEDRKAAAEIWNLLYTFFEHDATVKTARGLEHVSAFLYARGIVLQPPVLDTALKGRGNQALESVIAVYKGIVGYNSRKGFLNIPPGHTILKIDFSPLGLRQNAGDEVIKPALAKILCGLRERPGLRPFEMTGTALSFCLPLDGARDAAQFIRNCAGVPFILAAATFAP